MPATLDEVAAAVREALGDGAAQGPEDLAAALQKSGVDLGVEPVEVVADVLDGDDLGLVLPLLDDRYALLPALLRDRTFTHRVTAAEVEGGYLTVSPDLEPISILTEDATYRRLTDGGPLTEVLPDFDAALLEERGITGDDLGDALWLLAPDALQRLGVSAGDLVAVTVRADGFELVALPGVLDDPHDLGSRLSDILDKYAHGHPVQISDVVWQAAADDPTLFASPSPPLREIFAGAGLAWEDEQVAPGGFDFAQWRTAARLRHLADVHDLDDDEALAVLGLSAVSDQVASVVEYAERAVADGADLDELVASLFGTDPSESAPGAEDAAPAGEKRVVRELLEFLDTPAVAAALAVETLGAGHEGAAALGVFAETLEEQAPRSARPNLRWLRGRALERMGDVLDAETAYQEALAVDDSCQLALLDLARFASDRGDAERGLSLLRRAGAPQDDDLVVLLERFRPVERTDIGRNDRCWCGSGRKYKVCHRGREALPLEDRAAWLYHKAGDYVADGPWRTRVLDLAEIRSEHWSDPDALWQAVDDPIVVDALLFEGGVFEAFLEQRGALLPDDEQLLAQQWLLADRSVHEIEAVSPGVGFTARDLRTGDRLEVRERTASRTLRAGALICARLVPAGDTVQCFGGIEPVGLRERDALIALLDDEPPAEELVAFLSRRFAPPTLQNTEGDPLVFCETRLRTTDSAALAARLDDVYERVEGEDRWHETVVTHGMPRTRATLTVTGDELLVETNSQARMDRVLATLGRSVPDLEVVEQTRHPAEDVQEAMQRAPAPPAGGFLDPDDPEVAALLEQVVRQYEDAWLDESVPALAGLTPREAAADPTRRPDLIRLLDSFPTPGPREPGLMSADRLRAALGL